MGRIDSSTLTRSSALIIFLVLSVPAVAQQRDVAAGLEGRDLPVTIEAMQDVKVRRSEVRSDGSYGQQRGTLYAAADFDINAGQQFQMVAVGLEGGCRIQFQGTQVELHSCPWLQGFTDHQEDIFKVFRNEIDAD